MRPKTPKMLPWLAKSAGVPIARAEELWADAIRYATIETGWVETSEYWRVANRRLLELLEAEALTCHPPQLTPWVMINMRMGALPMIAANGFALVWTAALGRMNRCHQRRWMELRRAA